MFETRDCILTIRNCFFSVAAAKNVAAYEKAEDPGYVLENNVPIDFKPVSCFYVAKEEREREKGRGSQSK